MNCSQIRDLLSAYLDGELAPQSHASTAEHLAQCAACAEALVRYERLSRLANSSRGEPEPASDWSALEQRLNNQAPAPRSARRDWWARPAGLTAAAAVLLITVGLVVSAQRGPWGKAQDPMVVDFDHYLDDFAQSPALAQDHLLADYHGREADFSSAARLVGFTLAAQNPPAGYVVAGVYVLEMPRSRCPEIVLQRPDGSRLALFEHQSQQFCRFGDRPAIHATCCGRDAWVVEGENHLLAATWQSTSRQFILVGARDLAEVTQMVGHFEGGAVPAGWPR